MKKTNKTSEWLRKLKEERGESLPEEDTVELRHDIHWVWEAFCLLSLQRHFSSDPNPISLSDLYSYVKLVGVHKHDEIDFLVRMIPQLDSVWLSDFHTKKSKREKEEARKGKKPPRNKR